MKLTTWIAAALATTLLGCANESGYAESSPAGADRDVDAADGGSAKPRDGGSKAGTDAGRKSDRTSTGSGRDGDDDDNTCDSLNISATPNPPEILIVLDRSASMIGAGGARNAGKNRWLPSVSAIQKLTAQLGETVSFGLMTFPARDPLAALLGGGICAPGAVDVPIAKGNAARIASVLMGGPPDLTGATPTVKTLEAAYTALSPRCADCAEAPKYVLLVTDGQPTCGAGGNTTTLPEDIAATNGALDKLREANIETYVIGYDTASDPAAAAAMDEFAQHGGTEKHYPVENEQTLLTELTRIAAGLVPCEFELADEIDDPAFVRVTIDGKQYNLSDGAWRIEGKKKIVLEGACETLRDAKVHRLSIVKECSPVDVI